MSVRKIIVVRNDRFGEFLLNIPVFGVLKKRFPQAALTGIVNPYVLPLAQRVIFFDKVVSWESVSHGIFAKLRFIRFLKKEDADIIINLNPSRESNFLAFCAGIPLRVGYNRKWGFLLNKKAADLKSQGARHEVEYNLDLLRAAGIEPLGVDFKVALDISAKDFSEARFSSLGLEDKRFIVLNPCSSNPQKEWGLGNFLEVARKIIFELSFKAVLIGVKDDALRMQSIFKGLNVVNLIGETSLLELGGLLKRSSLLVTNDSGPMHLAAVLGTPTVSIFRKTPPAVSARRWGPVGDFHQILENDDLQRIRISEVYDAVKKILPR